MIGLNTLVLNADMIPISLLPIEKISVERAITRVFNGTCFVVEEYDRKIKTENININWPSVIARKEFLNHPHDVGLSDDNLYYRDHAVCAYCGRTLTITQVTMDHVIPKSVGGKKVWTNIVAACRKCNQEKDNKMPTGIWTPNTQPHTPEYWDLLKTRRQHPITIDHESWIPYLGDWKAEVRIRK
tara:strand:- start:4031 stop:4585 length:555 start_codon:yes stop_codon:yes gene_type:complete